MELNLDSSLKELSPKECSQINGGEPGDLLYYVGYVLSFYITMEINIIKTGIEGAKIALHAAENAWKECPVSVAEWN
jgi:hypothetical protein